MSHKKKRFIYGEEQIFSGVNKPWKSHRRIVLLSWKTIHVTSMSKWSLQQLLKLITFALKCNYGSICIYAFLHNTQRFPVPSLWRKLKWRHKACHRTAAACLPLSWGGEKVWFKMQSWWRLWLDHRFAVWQRGVPRHDTMQQNAKMGLEDYNQISLPRNSCGKACACRCV